MNFENETFEESASRYSMGAKISVSSRSINPYSFKMNRRFCESVQKRLRF